MVDQMSINKINSNASIASDGTITFVTTGVYKIHFSGSMEADNGEVVMFNYNYNGSHMIANPPQFNGLGGTKPISINNSIVVNATAGDTMYIEAKSDTASTTVTPLGCGMMVEKTVY
jgi:hypothetical protein